AVRCGNLNAQTRSIFEKLKIKAPRYLKDVKTVVDDVVNREVPRLEISDPLQTAIGLLDETGLSLLPVFDENSDYKGTISSVEISHFLMSETFGARPTYRFRRENLSKVVPGRILFRGESSEFTAPIMIGAMPFERSVERIAALESNRPLLIVGLRRDLVEYAITHDFPAVILTGATVEEAAELDFSLYKGSVYLSDVDTAETIRLLRFSTPLEGILETDSEHLDITDDFNHAKKTLSKSGRRGLPVFDEKLFVGIVSRGSFLDRPGKNLILVDHNELEQSISGAKDANILEIIDHHRVGSVMSREPFSLYTRPVGCTCTIIRQLYRQHGIAIPTEIAKLMISAILSDTVLLKSPTTTDEDRQTVEGLARHAGIDWLEWGREMFESGARLTDIDPDLAVSGDFKTYESGNIRFGIGQVEVQTLTGLEDVIPRLNSSLIKIKDIKALDGTMLLITDVMSEDSILLLQGLKNAGSVLPYELMTEGVMNLPGILSRKKQLLPEILRAMDETRSTNH
ncbi:MAG: putative manganese-dependent inorganic diphosphatase, partial [Spirochaetaceae bacterium]|nr:putative manganese-dependent inorganic diphosphatase [Spirochaetaceae bacterium]